MMGPVPAVTQTLAKVRMRALATALVSLVVNLIGAGLGPLAVGVSSDLLAPSGGRAQSGMPCSYRQSRRCLEPRSVSVGRTTSGV